MRGHHSLPVLVIVIVMALFPSPSFGQDRGWPSQYPDVVEHPLPPLSDDDQSTPFVDDSAACARYRITTPWMFIAHPWYQWVYYHWEPQEGACFMTYLAETSDTSLLFFEAYQRSHDDIDCSQSTQKRFYCTVKGEVGTPMWVSVKITAPEVSVGTTLLTFNDSSSGLARIFTVYTQFNGFMNFGPTISYFDPLRPN